MLESILLDNFEKSKYCFIFILENSSPSVLHQENDDADVGSLWPIQQLPRQIHDRYSFSHDKVWQNLNANSSVSQSAMINTNHHLLGKVFSWLYNCLIVMDFKNRLWCCFDRWS
jgi:hypothetical protein